MGNIISLLQEVFAFGQILEVVLSYLAVFSLAGYGLLKLTAKRKLRAGVSQGKPTLVNFSGHPAKPQWLSEEWEVIDMPLHVDMTNHSLLVRELEENLRSLPSELLARLASGDTSIVIAFPGMAVLALSLQAILHGFIGQFVVMTYAIRSPEGKFHWHKPVDLQKVRLDARKGFRLETV